MDCKNKKINVSTNPLFNVMNSNVVFKCVNLLNDSLTINGANTFKKKTSDKIIEFLNCVGITEPYVDSNAYYLFDFNKEQMAKPILNTPVNLPESDGERVWLCNMINDERIKLFLDDDEIKCLKEELQDKYATENTLCCYQENYTPKNKDKLTDDFISNFKALTKAIREHRQISFDYTTSSDKKVFSNNNVTPYKIEYQVTDGRFCLVFGSTRMIKAYISSISNIQILQPCSGSSDFLTAINDSVRKNKPITLTVYNRNNAIDRVMYLFMAQTHTITNIQYNDCENHTISNIKEFDMSLEYFRFEENEIIGKILSLGPNVKVQQPQRIVAEIKKRISQM